MVTVTADQAINAEGLADAREAAADPAATLGPGPYDSPPCGCYSCNRECGGTVHPGSCGPTVPDAEGRLICRACAEMADVWGDHRTGLQAAICQDRVRVQVKFGESAWLNPASAVAFAGVLLERALELHATRAADLAELRELAATTQAAATAAVAAVEDAIAEASE